MNLKALFGRPTTPKLYLSSLGIPDAKEYLALFNKKQPRGVAIIPTGWNVYPAEKAKPSLDRAAADFAALGIATNIIDLAKYGGKKDALAAKLAGFSGVWLMGGNCFYLNYWLHESGFDELLPELLAQGLVYGGESAGAAVAGKTLHGLEVLDNPADAPEIIWPGLGLVDYGIIPHWGSAKYAERSQQAYEEMRLFSPVKTLSDSEFVTT